MVSPPSHRTDAPQPAPAEPEPDLFAPAPRKKDVAPGDPTITRTGRHARHSRPEDEPAAPAVGPQAEAPVVAPAWLPVPQAARTPPAGTPMTGIPVPVFAVPEVRVPDAVAEPPAPAPPQGGPAEGKSRSDWDRTDPTPDDRAPSTTSSGRARPAWDTTVPDPDKARANPAAADPPAAPERPGTSTDQVLPGPLPAGPGDPTVVHQVRPRPRPSATGTGLPAVRAAPTGRPQSATGSSASLPRVQPRPPAPGGSPGFAPARPPDPGAPPVTATGSAGFSAVLPQRPGPQPGPPSPRPGPSATGSSAGFPAVGRVPVVGPPPGPPAPRPPDAASGPDGRLGAGAPRGDRPLHRAARFAVHLVSTTRATRELAELAGTVQAPVTTGRRIAVVSVRGGAGRSTVTALLGSVFAARRGDHVLVADADPDHGSLAWRLGLQEREPLPVLAPRLLAARGVAELDALLASTRGGLRMLPGAPGAPPAMTRDVTRALSRFFAICVTDCGRGLEVPGTAEVLREAHAVVLVTPATPDGVRSTRAGLARLPPALLSRVAVVLNTADRGGRAALDLGAARSALAGTGAPVVVLPYDRHLAAGTPISPERLAEATTVEATRLAGLALRCATGGPAGPP